MKGELNGKYRQLETLRYGRVNRTPSFSQSLFAAFTGKPVVDETAIMESQLMDSIRNGESELEYFKRALESNHIDLIPPAYQRVDVLTSILHILKSAQASTLPEAYRIYERDKHCREQEKIEQRRYEEQMALQRQKLELERKRMEMGRF